MSDEIKKLLSIMNETMTSGSVAPVSGGIGKSMLKRPADSIFAAESVPQDADTGLEAAPKVDSPANFGLWKNSAVIGKEQIGKHGRKKMAVNKTQMYPQLAEAFDPEQEVIDNTRRSRLGRERNAGLNEPDEKPTPHKEVDFGTWHFTANGEPIKKDGEVFYSSSKKQNENILAHLRNKAATNGTDIEFAVVQGPVKMQESYSEPKDMDDWSEEDWREWDAKVGRVGAKAKAQDEKEGVTEGNPGYDKHSFIGKIRRGREADNKGWGELGNLFAADNEKDAEKALRKGNRYYNMTRGSNKTPGGFPKTTFEEQGVAGRKAKLDEYSEWDGTGDQDLAAATASNGQEAGFADIEDKTSISEDGELKRVKREYNQAAKDAGGDRPGAGKKIDNMKKSLRQRDVGKDRSVKEDQEITEEMIADRLKSELDLFKKGTKSKDKSIGKKPADREVQEKRTESKSSMTKKSKKQ